MTKKLKNKKSQATVLTDITITLLILFIILLFFGITFLKSDVRQKNMRFEYIGVGMQNNIHAYLKTEVEDGKTLSDIIVDYYLTKIDIRLNTAEKQKKAEELEQHIYNTFLKFPIVPLKSDSEPQEFSEDRPLLFEIKNFYGDILLSYDVFGSTKGLIPFVEMSTYLPMPDSLWLKVSVFIYYPPFPYGEGLGGAW